MTPYVSDTATAKVVAEMPYGYRCGVADLPRIGYRIRAVYQMNFIDANGVESRDHLIANSAESLISNWAVTVVHAQQNKKENQ